MIPRGPRNTKTNKSQTLPFWSWHGTWPCWCSSLVLPDSPAYLPPPSTWLCLGSSHLKHCLFPRVDFTHAHVQSELGPRPCHPPTHTHTHTRTHSHTHSYTFNHTHSHTHSCTCTHTHTLLPIHTHTHTYPSLPGHAFLILQVSANVPSLGRPSLTVLLPTPD